MFFFFQAEDGIRDVAVTGVQTCALPIFILVVGDGTTTFLGNGGGNGEFDGAIFAATTRDANGNQLPNFGSVNFDINGGGGKGMYYNNCWINRVEQPPSYQIPSFQEP